MDIAGGNTIVEFNLNFEGTDYTITDKLSTATELLNDPEAANKYMQLFLHGNEENYNIPQSGNESETISSGECSLWRNKRKSTEKDVEATSYFLKLREQYSKLFDDKKTNKTSIWIKIGEELQQAGFYLCENKREAAEKCRQKFANMQRQYLAYVNKVKTTGEGKHEPPAFFDEMHGILGHKDKIQPQRLMDTEEPQPVIHDDEAGSSITPESSASAIKNRFQHIVKAKPESNKNALLDLMKTQFDIEQEQRQAQFNTLERLLTVQNDQRERLLGHFDKLFAPKKRRRSESDSDE